MATMTAPPIHDGSIAKEQSSSNSSSGKYLSNKREMMARSKSARALLSTTKGTMKSLRNLMGSLHGGSSSQHKALRHIEFMSDSEDEDDSNDKIVDNESISKDDEDDDFA